MVRAALRTFRPASLIDVGCGAGDIPRALVRQARKEGRALNVTCVDWSAQVLEIAQRRARDPALTFVRAEGEALPFEAGSFDVAICNLTLHHCEPHGAVALMREMRRVARQGCILTDLRRSRWIWLATWIASRIGTRNRLSRHDAPLSVLRAYTPAEAIELARQAGWRNPRLGRAPIGRMVLVDA